MQSTVAPSPGELVRARGRLWLVRSLSRFPDCTAFRLEEAGGAAGNRSLTLIAPFDRPERVARRPVLRAVSRRRWMRHAAMTLARAHPADTLLAPAAARMDLLPYQLEPAITVVFEGAARILVADAVGLGKTVQAGLIIRELHLRRLAERVLVLTPAGLRHQWAHELRRRFHLPCSVLDAAELAAVRSRIPGTVNPWSVPQIVIASFDFVKRPDVAPGPEDVCWDLVVIDEAHQVAPGTLRRAVAERLASRAPRVVLLTATPHTGDDQAYAALCALGEIRQGEGALREPSLVVFRRGRGDVGFTGSRRVRLRTVALAPPERRMHASLVALARDIWRERAGRDEIASRLAVSVLLKRALSTPASLVRSLEHRMAWLAGRPAAGPEQMELFSREEEETADLPNPAAVSAPGLRDSAGELERLARIAAEARLAAAAPSKVRALRRILSRHLEPAIVFTEYRDTLEELARRIRPTATCAVLHGGLDARARAAALRAFALGRARVLLATDAAGEGLNLQARCRLAINFELPWNPMRLEQRIGRVDRIGQTREVLGVHLVARDTLESRVLARLIVRIERARQALGQLASPLGPGADAELAGAFLAGSGIDALWTPAQAAPRSGPAPAPAARHGVTMRAIDECRRAEDRRRLLATRVSGHTKRRASPAELRGCPVTWLTGSRSRRSWLSRCTGRHSGLLLMFEGWIADGHGHLIESVVVPIWCDRAPEATADRRLALALVAHAVEAVSIGAVERARREISRRAEALSRVLAPGDRNHRMRLTALARQAASRPPLIQPGLFEQRALREARRTPAGRRSPAALDDSGLRPERGPGIYHPVGDPVLVSVFGLLEEGRRSCSPA